MHLIDHGRNYVEKKYQRPFIEKTFRNFLSKTLPKPKIFKFLILFAKLGQIFKFLLPKNLKSMLDVAPKKIYRKTWCSPIGDANHHFDIGSMTINHLAQPKCSTSLFALISSSSISSLLLCTDKATTRLGPNNLRPSAISFAISLASSLIIISRFTAAS